MNDSPTTPYGNTVRDLRRFSCSITDAGDRELIQHAADLIEVLAKPASEIRLYSNTHGEGHVHGGRPMTLRECAKAEEVQLNDKMSGTWSYDAKDGIFYNSSFTHDATLKLSGDFTDEYKKTQYAARLLTALNTAPSATHTSDDEALLLHAVLNQARETLLVGIKGTPEDLQRSLGKLNFACLAHWNWRGEKVIAAGKSALADRGAK